MEIPSTVAEITNGWLSEALAAETGGATVTAITVDDIGEGTGIFGEIARLHVSYDRGDGPRTVVAKLPCSEPENLAVAQALGIYAREVAFFREVAPTTPLRIPRCYLGELGDDGGFVLLLEDLGTDYEVGDQVIGATADQAGAVIDALAELHATWWEDERLHDLDWLPVPNAPQYLAAVPDIYRNGMPILEAEWAGRLPAACLDVARMLEPRFEELMHRISEPPHTFSHADTRLDNLFFARDGSGGVAFIDFQLSLRQRGVTDLAYLIGTSVQLDHARTQWEQLVRRWHDRLAAHGVTDYPWEECVVHYKEAALYYLVGAMSLIGSFDTGNERGAAMAEAYTTRIFNHVVDIDAFTVF